jgi:gliding motility-associated-like protein
MVHFTSLQDNFRILPGILCLFLGFWSTVLPAQSCDPNGNILIFSNYDGGYLRILIDEDIPNLKIGVASYEPTRISIFGPYAANVTEVHYAGLNPTAGTGNFHCDPSLAVTSVDPLPNPNATVAFAQVPPVTIVAMDFDTTFPGLPDRIGYNGGILGCTSCSLTNGTGGVNNYVQVLDYFTTYFNGSARFIKTRYGCWCDTLNCSLPIACCQELNSGSSQALILTASSDTLCNNQIVTISATTGFDTYSWSTGANTSSIQVTTAGTYTVTAQNECGAYTAEITIEPCPTEDCKNGIDDDGDGLIDLNDPDCACNGSNTLAKILLQAGGPCDATIAFRAQFIPGVVSYQWYRNNIALPNANGPVLVIDNKTVNSGDYSVLLTFLDGTCSLSSAEAVVFNTAPEYQATVSPANCFGEATGMVDLNFTNNISLLSIEWFDAAGQLLGNQARVTQLPAGTYALKIRYGAQCVLSDTFIIVQPLELLLKAEVTDATCNTNGLGKILLGIEGGTTPYLISLDNGTPGTAATFELPAGTYNIKVTDAEGCEKELDTLRILAAPTFSLGIEGPTSILEIGDTFQLKAVSSYPLNQLTLNWLPDGSLNCNNCPLAQGIALGNTQFALSAIDPLGCTATAYWEIKVDQSIEFYVPNIFIVNDSGINDQFQIFPGKGVERVISLQIFDRWGNIVHDSVEAWDGRVKGKEGIAGVYTWLAEIKFLNGKIERKSGNVTLIR